METVMSNEAVAVLNPESAYDGLLKWFPEALIPFMEMVR
jgi:hypothetical protein